MTDPARNPAGEGLAEALRRLVLAVEASGRAILPSSDDELLNTIVEAAARIFGAAAASIALLTDAPADATSGDEPPAAGRGQMLAFRVAYGAGRDEVLGLKIPVGEGIAGYVALTGQPLAISNVQQDARFAQGAAERTGYVPHAILAMPLLLQDRVIGVMEVLDKVGAPSFGIQDMELLALFARQAAVAIHASQQYDQLGQALLQGIAELLGPAAAAEWRSLPGGPESADVLALARTFNAVSRLGEAERRTCLQIMDAFAEYARSRPALMSLPT